MLSVIIPAYNEEGLIIPGARTVASYFRDTGIEYELIFVDDGSTDATWAEIRFAAEADSNIHGISFSRNFGKEAAIFAGLERARGDCCAVMDCDMQHPPGKLVEMYRLWQQGYEVVNGVKSNRGRESRVHGFAARSFYKLMSRAVRIDMSRASDFKLMDRKVVDTLLRLPERQTFFRALVGWAGYKTAEVEFDVAERREGNTKWSTLSLIRYAVNNITSYSSAPMQVVTVLGCLTLLVALGFGIQTMVYWLSGKAASGFTTVILLLLFIGSILMISLGIIGYYISQIFTEMKGRPRYIITDEIDRKNRRE